MGGFCLAWCMWWVEFYIKNIHNGYLLSEYIRNYANYMHQKLIINLSIDTLPLNVLLDEEYKRN